MHEHVSAAEGITRLEKKDSGGCPTGVIEGEKAMKVRIISDFHTEFWSREGDCVFRSMPTAIPL